MSKSNVIQFERDERVIYRNPEGKEEEGTIVKFHPDSCRRGVAEIRRPAGRKISRKAQYVRKA